jgi:anti-anti-sigma factor
MNIAVQVFEHSTVLTVGGRIGWQNSLVLNHEIKNYLPQSNRTLIIHLQNVTFLSSAAIAILASNAKRTQDELPNSFLIVTSESYVLEILNTTGVHKALESQIHKTLDDMMLKTRIFQGKLLREMSINTDDIL